MHESDAHFPRHRGSRYTSTFPSCMMVVQQEMDNHTDSRSFSTAQAETTPGSSGAGVLYLTRAGVSVALADLPDFKILIVPRRRSFCLCLVVLVF